MSPTGPLRAEAFSDAVVMPFTPFKRPNGRTGVHMGVFDDHDKVVPGSLLFRSYGKVGFAADFSPATRAAAGHDPRSVIYAGRLTRHFGHFTLEGLARLWYARQRPELPLAWVSPSDEPPRRYKPYQAALLEVLGIDNEPIFVREPTRFGEVVVPEPGYRIKDFMAPEHAAFLAAYPARTRDRELRLWLSRARVDPGVLHAQRLEDALAAGGWTIVHPETLTIPEQLELLATAGRVAGDQGSAFHLLALLADVRGLLVDIFCRHPNRTAEEQNANYQTIAAMRALDQHLHVVPEEVLIEEDSAHVTKLATTLAPYLDILGVDRPRPPSTSPAAGASLVHDMAAAAGARAYLELTVAEPLGLDLDVPLRHVVSAAFSFDPRDRAGEGLALFEMPPDEYLEHLPTPGLGFDMVVVDAPPFVTDEWVERIRARATPGASWLVAGETPVAQLSGSVARCIEEDGRSWWVFPGTDAVQNALDRR